VAVPERVDDRRHLPATLPTASKRSSGWPRLDGTMTCGPSNSSAARRKSKPCFAMLRSRLRSSHWNAMSFYGHSLCTLVNQVIGSGERVSAAPGEKVKKGLDLGGSSAHSVILMLIVIALTVLQFRYVERRVQYQ
jgi:hypothetical protein